MNRIYLFRMMLPLFLCLGCMFANLSAYAATMESDEPSVLANWKATASKTAVGNQLQQLLASTTTIIRSDTRNKQALYLRGYLYGVIGCTGYAIADLTRAIEMDPSFAAAYTERGICYMDLKNYERAKYDLDVAIRLAPCSGDARLAHGKLMLELDKPSIAANDFRACQLSTVRFVPALPGELPSNYYNAPEYYLGVCDESTGHMDSALKHYKAAVRTPRLGGAGYIKRYSDQPLDVAARISMLELAP